MITIIVIIFVILGVLYYLFPLINVIGDSMYPTYHDGEIIVGTKIYRKSKLKKGDVIIYKTPTDEKVVIKRIDLALGGKRKLDYVYCLGDNADYSYDSRHYGFVSSKNIMCKVLNQRRYNNNVCNQERQDP